VFKGWVQTLLTRVNTINGRVYSEDPTVLAWVGTWAGGAWTGRVGGCLQARF